VTIGQRSWWVDRVTEPLLSVKSDFDETWYQLTRSGFDFAWFSSLCLPSASVSLVFVVLCIFNFFC